MSIPLSGAISIGNICTEKSISNTSSSLTILSTSNINSASAYKPNGSQPHAISEFLGYQHASSDTTPPSIPVNFVGTSKAGFIDFSWTASTDNSGTVAFYEIYRNDARYDETEYNGYRDYTEDTTSRTYKVRAVDANLNRSAFSATLTKRALSVQSCFVEGTLISLPNGNQVPIELLEVNQVLLSSEISTLMDTNNVSELYSWSDKELNEKRISSPISKIEKRTSDKTIIINKGLLEATPEHSQLIKRNGIWKFIPIGEVKVDDYLYNIKTEEIRVTSIDINTDKRSIYPMSLSPSHTYFANGILTHNVKAIE